MAHLPIDCARPRRTGCEQYAGLGNLWAMAHGAFHFEWNANRAHSVLDRPLPFQDYSLASPSASSSCDSELSLSSAKVFEALLLAACGKRDLTASEACCFMPRHVKDVFS